MFPGDLSTFPVVQTCALLGRCIPFLTSPCVKSELGSLPGSLRSKAPEHFSDLVRHLFFFLTFFHFHDQRIAHGWQNKWEENPQRYRGIPTRFQHWRSHRCIYAAAVLGLDVHPLTSILFSLVPRKKHLSSITSEVPDDSPTLCSLRTFAL